jgi:hypothetical protein
MQEYTVSLLVANARDTSIHFILEPWGEIYVMEPDAKFTVCLRSSIQGIVEIDDAGDGITVYAWGDCTATLFQNGQEVGAGAFERTRVPKKP